ncbi:elongator complex protein 5 isoform X2 [Prunus dulcis]|uniref:elongator complex protein 5 isoform X2 n=1 Tax=Prunus dulcis TaxID=3755 RepID=UPI001482CD53|nr:elongator complex protein 5 isoform X2 [Prunus dulcis]
MGLQSPSRRCVGGRACTRSHNQGLYTNTSRLRRLLPRSLPALHQHFSQKISVASSGARRVFSESVILCRLVEEERTGYFFFSAVHYRIRILDCYTDPLGWRERLMECGSAKNLSHEASNIASTCRNVKDVDKLFSSVISLGEGLVGQGKVRFSVAIDSVNEMLRHASLSSVAGLLSNLRCCDQISSIFWFLHADLCEEKVTAVIEYMSSMVASIEPLIPFANRHRGNSENLSLVERNFTKGKFHVRCKRRNGRVRVMFEEIHIGQSGIDFTSPSSEDGLVNQVNQGLLPKVQFNLQLSEKERNDRAKVVLPFEHQGNGKPVEIYDGRKSLMDSKNEAAPVSTGNSKINDDSSKGEIIYFRDSDDEMPDSDEDPDDDLDI